MKYSHYKIIPHFYILRLIVVSPFALIYFVFKFITEQLERFANLLEKILPDAYEYQRLEFYELPQKQQDKIKALNKLIMSQVQKINHD